MAGDEQDHQALGDRAAALIREANQTEAMPDRRRLAGQAIELLDTLIDAPDADADVRRRSRYDRILALRAKESMPAIIRDYQALLADGESPPYWVTEAAADAWLHQGNPEQAEVLYREVLAVRPDAHNTRIALFYALFEQEKHEQALNHIDALVSDTADQVGQWEWIEARVTSALARAWTNRLDLAEQQLSEVLAVAPDNARALREMATVERWRGWSNRAFNTAEQASRQAPDDVAIRLLRTNLLNDLGDYASADAGYRQLAAEYPEHLHVQRDYAAWQHRHRWSMSLHGELGDSDGPAISEFGSRDRALRLRLNAPWLGNHLQPWFFHDYSDAQFPEGEADYDRVGAGLSWRSRGHHAWLSGHANRQGPRDGGVSLGYELRLDDHWSLAGRVDSFSTDVPLRARNQGIDGSRAELSARWQRDESLAVRANFSRLSLSDGNVRLAALVAVPHRLRASASHITSASLDVYGSRASQQGGPYFNPERDASALYLVEHDWLTWRRYERRFSQVFTLAGGAYWQQGFGNSPIGLARYEHRWQLGDRWHLRYGVGWASRVYDGEREERIDGRIGLEGVF